MIPASTSTYNHHNLWIRSLESVLENRYVFDAFHRWLSTENCIESLLIDFPLSPHSKTTFCQKHTNTERKLDALEVYLAIMAFHKCVVKSDPKTKQMAMALHRRFISPRTGTCHFIPMDIRCEISTQIHEAISKNAAEIKMNLFDKCLNSIWTFLSQQHALFVCSKDYAELENRLNYEEDSNNFNNSREMQYSEEIPIFGGQTQKFGTVGSNSGSSCCSSGLSVPATFRHSKRLENILENENSSNNLLIKSEFFDGQQQKLEYPNLGLLKQKSRSRTRSEPLTTSSNFNKSTSSSTHPMSLNNSIDSNTMPKKYLTNRNYFSEDNFTRQDFPSKIDHEIPEDRLIFVNWICHCLEKILREVKLSEENTGEVVFPRELYSKRNLGSWDEDDTVAPEFLCDWMRASATPVLIELPLKDVSYHNTYRDFHPTNNSFLEYEKKIADQRRQRVDFVYAKSGGRIPFANNINEFVPSFQNSINNLMTENSPTIKYQNSRFAPAPSICGEANYSDSSGFCSSDSAYWQFLDSSLRNSQSFDNSIIKNKKTQKSMLFENNEEKNLCSNLLTICYKESDGVPFVVKMEPHNVTFREFRHHFGISSKTNKSICEDGTSPYQWNVVNDEYTILPIFEGRITAQCRTVSPEL